MITKNIGYAYPTSPLAKALGHNNTGCWYIAVYDDSKPISVYDVVYACLTKEHALYMVAESTGSETEWGAYSLHKN